MPNVTITLLVDTTALFLDPTLSLDDCSTLAQMGGLPSDNSSNALRKFLSNVFIGDIITWNGISNSTSLPSNVKSVVVNITAITATTVFGQSQLLPTSLNPGASGGSSVQGQISSGSEGDTITYTISFNYVTTAGDGATTTSPTYNIDPKIQVHAPH